MRTKIDVFILYGAVDEAIFYKEHLEMARHRITVHGIVFRNYHLKTFNVLHPIVDHSAPLHPHHKRTLKLDVVRVTPLLVDAMMDEP